VLSEGATVHCEVAPPIVKGIIVSGSRSLWVLWERSARALDSRLVFDDIEDIVK